MFFKKDCIFVNKNTFIFVPLNKKIGHEREI